MSELRFRKRGRGWEYSFEAAPIGGKRRSISKGGFRTKAEASAAGAKAMNEYNSSGSVFTPSEISTADYLDFWMETYCKVNCKPSTYANYEKKIRLHIKPLIGKYRLAALTPEVLQHLINDKFNAGYSRNSLAVIKGILTGSLAYAVQPLKYLQLSPAVYISLPSTRAIPACPTRSDPHVYVTPDQMDMLLTRFPEGTTSYLPLLIGYKCGLRLGEAFGLTWEDIDFQAKTLTVNQQVLRRDPDRLTGAPSYWYVTQPKYNSVRTIELSQDVIDALLRERERQEKAKPIYDDLYTTLYKDKTGHINTVGNGDELHLVMVHEDGSMIYSWTTNYISQVAVKELGFKKFDYHSLRHTHATILAEKGANPKYVQHRLGHKNIQVTMQIYQHLTQEMSSNDAQLLDTF